MSTLLTNMTIKKVQSSSMIEVHQHQINDYFKGFEKNIKIDPKYAEPNVTVDFVERAFEKGIVPGAIIYSRIHHVCRVGPVEGWRVAGAHYEYNQQHQSEQWKDLGVFDMSVGGGFWLYHPSYGWSTLCTVIPD